LIFEKVLECGGLFFGVFDGIEHIAAGPLVGG